MRTLILVFSLLLGFMPAAFSRHFGWRLSEAPRLETIPGYGVRYAPGLDTNYFWHDGRYWVFEEGLWHASPHFDGPWTAIPPKDVPQPLLQVPQRYYNNPPARFSQWRDGGPPRWSQYWGRDYERRDLPAGSLRQYKEPSRWTAEDWAAEDREQARRRLEQEKQHSGG